MTDVTYLKPPRHSWVSVRSIPACESPDGCERTERTCGNPNCGLVRITVHPPRGFAYPKWRHANGSEFQVGNTPPCGALIEVASSEAGILPQPSPASDSKSSAQAVPVPQSTLSTGTTASGGDARA